MIYAMSDFHLPSSLNKDMNMFGWGNHVEKIKDNWSLTDNDTIIMPGDLSWALKENELVCDLELIESLKGKKILLKGNHDYWWNSKNKLKEILKPYPSIQFIQYGSLEVEGICICGTRGWDIKANTDEDKKHIEREAGRLRASILSSTNNNKIVFMHYPPIYKDFDFDLYLNIFKEYEIKKVYYGHLHGNAIDDAIQGVYDGIEFKCIAADQIDFTPIKIV